MRARIGKETKPSKNKAIWPPRNCEERRQSLLTSFIEGCTAPSAGAADAGSCPARCGWGAMISDIGSAIGGHLLGEERRSGQAGLLGPRRLAGICRPRSGRVSRLESIRAFGGAPSPRYLVCGP